MKFRRSEPYSTLPLLPPAKNLETKAIMRQTIRAARALADLKGAAAKMPNQRILINSIVGQEARPSSEIENIVTTSDELARRIRYVDITDTFSTCVDFPSFIDTSFQYTRFAYISPKT